MATVPDAQVTDPYPVVLHTRVVSHTGGGPDKTILNSPRYLSQNGYHAICAYMRHPDDTGFSELEERARLWHAPILAVDDHGPLDWRILERFRRICQLHRPRIWHGHDYKSNLLGLLTRRSHPMSLVTTVHGWGVQRTWKTPLYYAIDRSCIKFYDRVVCVSQELLDKCLQLGVSPTRCHLVPNAIDTEEYRRSKSVLAAKAAQGLGDHRLVIGAVGRLSREKGFDLLVRAVHQLRGEGSDLELCIAGEGGARAELEALITELGIADRVKLLGYQPDMLCLYHMLDVLVVSSLSEGLPNALLEAMAFELAVLCTRCGGIPSVVRNQENGLLAEVGSVTDLVDGLRTLATNPGLRARLGKAARATIESRFSFHSRMETIRLIYDEVLGEPDSV